MTIEVDEFPTKFAPASSALPDMLERQAQQLENALLPVRPVLDAMPDLVMVLNGYRQVVLANRSLLDYLHLDERAPRGLRPGEVLGCGHSELEVGGCGTSEFCSTCGSLHAVQVSQQGRSDVQECRITRSETGEALDFRVWATPLEVEHECFTLLALLDISHEKRLRALEHIFFHDVLNTTTALRAAANLLASGHTADDAEIIGLLGRLVNRLIGEIIGQRQLVEAENNELAPRPRLVNVPALLEEIAESYRTQAAGLGRAVHVDAPAQPLTFVSDDSLVSRVLGNMLKNALEATPAGATVTLGYRLEGDHIAFWVRNPGEMPRSVQLQVFQRSFSTKGAGRGLGTYSMRLLSERYLGGTVTFESTAEGGTTFTARYPLQWGGSQRPAAVSDQPGW